MDEKKQQHAGWRNTAQALVLCFIAFGLSWEWIQQQITAGDAHYLLAILVVMVIFFVRVNVMFTQVAEWNSQRPKTEKKPSKPGNQGQPARSGG